MTNTTTGWVVFVAAIGAMFSLLAVDIVALKDFNEMYTPLFIGTFIGHMGSVIAAFVGGRLIPTAPDPRTGTERTRSGD